MNKKIRNILFGLVAALFTGAVIAAGVNVLPAVQGPNGPVMADPVAIIGYDSGTSAPCVVGRTVTCSLQSSGGAGGGASYTAAAAPFAVTAGTNKPAGIDLFSSLFITATDGAGHIVNLGGPSGVLGADGATITSLTNLFPVQNFGPWGLPANLVSGFTTAMTGTTSTAVTGMGAPGASLHNYVQTLVCGNSHATVGTFVDLQDGSGGTAFFKIPAGAVYNGSVITFPAPLRQPTANTALFAVDETTGANVICSAAGYKGA